MSFTKEDLKNPNWRVRLSVYEELGFTKDAFYDEYWTIRLHAYRELGFNEEAFNDIYWRIRLEAYEEIGFTEKSFTDNSIVQEEAERYFEEIKGFLLHNLINKDLLNGDKLSKKEVQLCELNNIKVNNKYKEK